MANTRLLVAESRSFQVISTTVLLCSTGLYLHKKIPGAILDPNFGRKAPKGRHCVLKKISNLTDDMRVKSNLCISGSVPQDFKQPLSLNDWLKASLLDQKETSLNIASSVPDLNKKLTPNTCYLGMEEPPVYLCQITTGIEGKDGPSPSLIKKAIIAKALEFATEKIKKKKA